MRIDIFDEIKSLYKDKKNFSISEKSDNIIIHSKGNGSKLMISVVDDNKNLIIRKVDKTRAEFDTTWEHGKNVLSNIIVYKNDEPIGVIRNESDKEFIELYCENEIKIGDIITLKTNDVCKSNILYTLNSTTEIVREIAKKIIYINSEHVNDIYFTVSKTIRGALSVANYIKPDYVLSVYTAESDESFVKGNGCGIVLKDGNAVTEPELYNYMLAVAKKKDIKYQTFIGKKNILVEQFGIVGTGAKAGGICISCSGCGGVLEVVNSNDVENTANLIACIIEKGIN